MAYRHVNTLSPGDPFRDWLVEEVVGDRLKNNSVWLMFLNTIPPILSADISSGVNISA